MGPTNLNERIAALETKVELHKSGGDTSREELKQKIEEMDKKLDTLLELKHKGAGVFMLASAIFGTGIIGFFYSVVEFFKGVH